MDQLQKCPSLFTFYNPRFVSSIKFGCALSCKESKNYTLLEIVLIYLLFKAVKTVVILCKDWKPNKRGLNIQPQTIFWLYLFDAYLSDLPTNSPHKCSRARAVFIGQQ